MPKRQDAASTDRAGFCRFASMNLRMELSSAVRADPLTAESSLALALPPSDKATSSAIILATDLLAVAGMASGCFRTDCRKSTDMKMRIEACRYLTWKSCQQFDLTGGKEHELPVMTKVFCSETCVDVVYDAMRVVGVDSYTDMHPLAELMNDAMCFPLYDGGNMGARRRQLHSIIKS